MKYIFSLLFLSSFSLFANDVEVSDTWARNAKAGQNSAAFGKFLSTKTKKIVNWNAFRNEEVQIT